MNMNIDTISLTILIIFNLFLGFRCVRQIKQIKTQQFLYVLLCVMIFGVAISEVALLVDQISFRHFELVFKTSITTTFSIFMTLISFIAINQLTAKKIKTLWRIPLTGFFAGLYFELKYMAMICAAYYFINFVILWKERVKFRYLISKLVLLFPAIVGIFYVELNNLYILNIILLWVIIFGSPIITLANINSAIPGEADLE